MKLVKKLAIIMLSAGMFSAHASTAGDQFVQENITKFLQAIPFVVQKAIAPSTGFFVSGLIVGIGIAKLDNNETKPGCAYITAGIASASILSFLILKSL